MNNVSSTNQIAIVTGATNQIGHFLLPRLPAAGFSKIIAISRYSQPARPGIIWQSLDLSTATPVLPHSQTEEGVLFHIAPLPLLPSLLTRLTSSIKLQRVITFSSTSRFTKLNSADPKERAIATTLMTAEQAMITYCQTHHLDWTLLRPTLIYGCGKDKNISFIANFIRRFGIFPLVGAGTGLRQPVHADDLAAACVQVYHSALTKNREYNLSGGQTLTYRQMVTAIFQRLQKTPRIITIPLPLFKLLTTSISWLPKFKHVSTAMLARMNQDLVFDHFLAIQEFGYQPRNFSDNDMGF